MGLKGPGDIRSDERIASAEGSVFAELLLDAGKCGVLPQAGCNLSEVFNRKQAEVAVAQLEHEVVCLHDLFRGGMEGEPGVGELWFGECSVYAVFLVVFLDLHIVDVGGDGSAPGRGEGRYGK